MRRKICAALACMILTVMFTGCGGGGGGTPAAPAILKSIAVTPSGPSIAPSTETQFAAQGTYSNGSTLDLTLLAIWSSSNTSIATISAGLATAGSLTGSTVITAVYSGITGSTMLTASEAVSLSLSPASPPSLAPGMKQQFTAFGTLANSAVQDLTSWAAWDSSNTGIAGINVSGLASAVAAPGATTISALFSGHTSSVTLTTSAVSSMTTSPAFASIAKGTSKQFFAAGMLVDGTPHDLTTWATWSSSNPAAAAISNAPGSKGRVASLATGTTLIFASFNAIVSNPASTLVVTPAVLTTIVTSPTSTRLALGRKLQYAATGRFSDSSYQDVTASATWSSSNESVAVISSTAGSNGLASSLSVGATTITASLSGITSNSSWLTITPTELVSIVVTPTFASIVCPVNSRQFTAIGTYTDGSSQDLTNTATWRSSDTNIAAVSNGLAITTCGVVGSTNITAEMSGVLPGIATLTVSYY